MCCLSCFITFWITKYNTPCTFCLADYSVVFCDRCLCLLPHITTNHSYCIHALGCNPSNKIHYPFSYQLTSWFCSEVSTTCYFPSTQVPLSEDRACKPTFFPLHLLHCYNHRSYQWSDPHGPEQACIDEPLLAQSCRTILLWLYHYSYSKETMLPNS